MMKRIMIVVLVLTLLAGCFMRDNLKQDNSPAKGDPTSTTLFGINKSSDRDLMERGLEHLSNDGNEPKYQEARADFTALVSQYPKSKWEPAARQYIVLIDEIAAMQKAALISDQKIRERNAAWGREIAELKEKLKISEERQQTEIEQLRQENEQLKNDLQQLKKLEIQLEKREKMLR